MGKQTEEREQGKQTEERRKDKKTEEREKDRKGGMKGRAVRDRSRPRDERKTD